MRVLGRIRLSHFTRESTSVERQKELIENWAEANDHTIIGWAEDIDVSGSISPFETPGLGPWFKDPKDREWDILCAWKLDRIARNSIGIHAVFQWLQENDKTLVCINDNIDLSNWVGRLVASVIAGVAEGELEAITERTRASKKALRQQGRWGGGRLPFGYRSVDTGEGKKLQKNPDEAKILDELIRQTLAGESAASIARDLNSRGVPSPSKSRHGSTTSGWKGPNVRRILRSKSLLGWMSHQNKPVLDASGAPVMLGEPLVTMETFNQIQEALDNRAKNRVAKQRSSPLVGILKCWECGKNMRVQRQRASRGDGLSYYCYGGCKGQYVNGKQVLEAVHARFLAELGDQPVMRKVVHRGSDVSTELEEAKSAYEDIASFLGTAPTGEARKQLFEQLTLVGEKIKKLEQTPSEDTVEWEPTGQLYRELWEPLDNDGKRELMLKAGIRVRARMLTKGNKHHPGILETEFTVPEDLREKLAAL